MPPAASQSSSNDSPARGWLRWAPLAAVLTAVAVLSFLPDVAYTGSRDGFAAFNELAWAPRADLVLHAALYALLGGTLALTLRPAGPWSALAAVLLPVVLGTAIEFLQPVLTANHQFHVHDLMANAVGAVAGVAAVLLVRRRRAGDRDENRASTNNDGD